MKKNIFIIGSKGYAKSYGYFETFVNNFIDNYEGNETKFYVFEKSSTKENNNVEIRNGVVCPKIYGRFFYKIMCLRYIYRKAKEDYDKNNIIYVLGYKKGLLFNLLLKKRNKNIKVIINPGRIKYNKINDFLLRKAIKNSDYVICASRTNEKYLREITDNLSYISYGANTNDVKEIDKTTLTLMERFNIKPREYYLMVGSFVKNNNFEYIINEFINSGIDKDLVIVSNYDERKKYYKQVLKLTDFKSNKHIKFVGSIYDNDILRKIRKYAKGYIQCNSVNETNYSLLESLSITDINIVLDSEYNREVAKDAALYFEFETNSLKDKLEQVEKFRSKEFNEYGDKAKEIIKDEYTWDIVIRKHEKIFKRLF
jgi:rhamnosyltransferase